MGGISFNKFTVNTRGVLYLGIDSIAPGFTMSGLLANSCANTMNIIGNIYSDSVKSLQNSDADPQFTQISYKMEGSDGTRVLIVQFKNILIRTGANYFDTLNYQIRLYEEDNKFQIVYKNAKVTAPTPLLNLGFSIGLKTKTNTDFAVLSASSNWEDFKKTESGTSKITFSKKVYPPDNLTYTFTPPPPCEASVPPSNFKFSKITSDAMTIGFTKSSADGHLVLQSTKAVLTQSPQNGTVYLKNNLLGDAKVIAFSKDTIYKIENLQASTPYYYHIFSYNNMCTGAIVYSTSFLLDSVQTLLGAPEIKRVKRDTNSITLQSIANQNNDQIIVTMHSTYKIVQPKGKLAVGDTLSNGALVIYKGLAKEFEINNLGINERLWISAWSVEDDTAYSTTNSQIGERTWAKIPVLYNFEKENVGTPAAGWSHLISNPTQLAAHYLVSQVQMVGEDYDLQAFANASSEGVSLPIDAITPSVVFAQGKHRLLFGFVAKVPGMLADVGYKLQAADSLLVQISDNGLDFKTIYVVNSENYTEQTSSVQNRVLEIEGYDNKVVNFRFVYYSPNRSKSAVSYVKVEKVYPCDYVTEVAVIDSTITNCSAMIDWKASQSSKLEPLSWNLSYKMPSDTLWSLIQNVSEKPGLISELMSQSSLQARVQAVCENNEKSVWSEPSPIFNTKYNVPLFANFEKDLWETGKNLPPYWTGTKKIFLPTDDIILPALNANASDWQISKWKQNVNTQAITCNFPASANSWFFTPVIDLGEDKSNLSFSFDFALAPRFAVGSLDSVNSQSRFLVALSTDGGKTYTNGDILKIYGAGSENKLGNLDSVHENFLLKGQSGKIQIGFYLENKGIASANSSIFVDNIYLDYSCPTAINLNTSNIGEDSVCVSWTSSDKASQWLVRYRAQDQENYIYQEVDTTFAVLHNLTETTPYQWEVLSLCAAQDSSKWTGNLFTTLTPYVCDTVLNSRVIRSSRHEMSIAWQGTASSYKFEYRKPDDSEWLSSKTDTTFIAIANLQAGTAYEYRIQAQCSEDSTDLSVWTAPKRFSTQYVTCPAPENFHTIKPTYESVTLVWKSEARTIKILLRESTVATWKDEFGSSARDTIELAGLAANTSYWIRIKMACAPGDESEWTDSVQFTTTDYPPCYVPKNLEARSITKNSVQLAWSTVQEAVNYTILFKESTVSKYDTTTDHIANTYTIQNLTENTAYTWKVRSRCGQYLYSQFSNASNFTTLPTSIEVNTEAKKDFMVYSQNGQIHIMNAQSRYVESVEILSIDGKQIGKYSIRSTDHVLIPTTLKNSMVVLRLQTAKGVFIYKNFVN